ncbi:MAG: M48 family metallopeptidase [Puniceicoccales bacterium]|jgi:STE24 endopeptidase|nr:M48 family metallopeptidase [Puniceicoccales bacterium]
MLVNSVTTTVVTLLLFKFIFENILHFINNYHILLHRKKIPHGFETFIDLPTYQNSVDYTLVKSNFSSFCGAWSLVFDIFLIFSGILPFLLQTGFNVFGNKNFGQAVTFLSIHFILSLFWIPFSWWRQFRLEDFFGFNRSTQNIFWTDKAKEYLLSFVFGFPIFYIIAWFFQSFPRSWWLWAWAILFIFQITMVIIYPLLILPLFNKLTPLPDGELKERLMQLAQTTQFPINKIFTMDGSKRSAHSNAFFIGLEKFRHIVLYDTLIEQMTTEEIAAVLAHEIGHYKHQHIRTNLIVEGVYSFLGFGILYYLSSRHWFLESFGFQTEYTLVPLILIFSIAISGITFWIDPFFNYLSRKHEYQADRFTADTLGQTEPLISSLRKLHKENLSNLAPHLIFSTFHYSHPTLLEREIALQNPTPDDHRTKA